METNDRTAKYKAKISIIRNSNLLRIEDRLYIRYEKFLPKRLSQKNDNIFMLKSKLILNMWHRHDAVLPERPAVAIGLYNRLY